MDDRIIIIKEYISTPNGERVVFILRTEYYDDSLRYFMDLFEEAQKNFPKLTPKQIKALCYNSDTHRRQRGIEFTLPNPVVIPKEYNLCIDLITTY